MFSMNATRNTQVVGAVCLTLAVLVGPLIAGEWGSVLMHADEDWESCDCGAVTGRVGALSSFVDGGAVAHGKKTTGTVGAKWEGERYPVCSHVQVQQAVWVRHTYTRTQGNPFTRRNVRVTLSSTLTTSGGAERLQAQDPQWWWDTTATIIEKAPVMQIFTSGQWVDLGLVFDPDHNTRAAGGAADATNNNQPDYTSAMVAGIGNQDGDTKAVGLTSDSQTKVRIQVDYDVTGGPCSGDNCDVDEEFKLTIMFETKWTA